MSIDRERLEALATDLKALAPPPVPTRDDRRARVCEALRRHPEASNRHLVRELGVSREMIAAARRQLLAAGELVEQETRVGRDGKDYKVRHPAAARRSHVPRAVRVRACLRAAYALSEGARLPAAVLAWITGPPATADGQDRRLA